MANDPEEKDGEESTDKAADEADKAEKDEAGE